MTPIFQQITSLNGYLNIKDARAPNYQFGHYHIKEKFGLKKLCIAGGVGLNCSLNGKIIDSKLFDEIFVQPASGDDGAAIGACFLSHKKLSECIIHNHQIFKKKYSN